ncbi:hypothetical protein BT69DRAFT_1321895 [Atractiella rhizophila]|nr:hypothetical protein BT69DRAFT_1321895 [Atractiella rhizophila]
MRITPIFSLFLFFQEVCSGFTPIGNFPCDGQGLSCQQQYNTPQGSYPDANLCNLNPHDTSQAFCFFGSPCFSDSNCDGGSCFGGKCVGNIGGNCSPLAEGTCQGKIHCGSDGVCGGYEAVFQAGLDPKLACVSGEASDDKCTQYTEEQLKEALNASETTTTTSDTTFTAASGFTTITTGGMIPSGQAGISPTTTKLSTTLIQRTTTTFDTTTGSSLLSDYPGPSGLTWITKGSLIAIPCAIGAIALAFLFYRRRWQRNTFVLPLPSPPPHPLPVLYPVPQTPPPAHVGVSTVSVEMYSISQMRE